MNKKRKRNNKSFDTWSLVHLGNGILLGWLLNPFIAFALMILWEPLEIFIISPVLAKAGIDFGYESVNNSLPDILVDALGITLGAWVLGAIVRPPFHWF